MISVYKVPTNNAKTLKWNKCRTQSRKIKKCNVLVTMQLRKKLFYAKKIYLLTEGSIIVLLFNSQT